MTQDDSRAPMERLDAALAALEAAVARVAGAETSRADLVDTLAIMDDDRQRLAADLDAALARTQALETANTTVGQRLEAMSGRLATLLDEAS